MNPDLTIPPADVTARLHACLDARVDPLDDDELVAALAARPELLAQFAQLRADALALPALAPARRTRLGRGRALALLGGAAAAAAAVLVVGWPRPHAELPRGPRVLTVRFDELRPRAWAAATFTITEPLVRTPTTSLETWQTRSERR